MRVNVMLNVNCGELVKDVVCQFHYVRVRGHILTLVMKQTDKELTI